jgi:hypothetical protein
MRLAHHLGTPEGVVLFLIDLTMMRETAAIPEMREGRENL